MTEDVNKAVIFRLVEEVFNQGKIEVITDLVAENVVGHEVGEELLYQDSPKERQQRGVDRFQETVMAFRNAFPDLQLSVFDVLAVEDKVVMRWGLQGTHQGAFLGVGPTGKVGKVQGIIIYRLEAEKIVEYWGIFDIYGLLQQLR